MLPSILKTGTSLNIKRNEKLKVLIVADEPDAGTLPEMLNQNYCTLSIPGFLIKPVEVDLLINLIAQHLGK